MSTPAEDQDDNNKALRAARASAVATCPQCGKDATLLGFPGKDAPLSVNDGSGGICLDCLRNQPVNVAPPLSILSFFSKEADGWKEVGKEVIQELMKRVGADGVATAHATTRLQSDEEVAARAAHGQIAMEQSYNEPEIAEIAAPQTLPQVGEQAVPPIDAPPQMSLPPALPTGEAPPLEGGVDVPMTVETTDVPPGPGTMIAPGTSPEGATQLPLDPSLAPPPVDPNVPPPPPDPANAAG